MYRETSITHLLMSFALVVMCGCFKEGTNSKGQDKRNEEVKCREVPSYDECRSLSHCSAIRLTKKPGSSGPIWACEEKSQP